MVVDRGSWGNVLDVGRLETGRGIGRGLWRVLAVVETEEVDFILGGGKLAILFAPRDGGARNAPAANRSLDAEGRRRETLASDAGAPRPPYPPLPRKLSTDGEGRREGARAGADTGDGAACACAIEVDFGIGRRDIGRGMPRDLAAAAGAAFSSIVAGGIACSASRGPWLQKG